MKKIAGLLAGAVISFGTIGLAFNNQSIVNTESHSLKEIKVLKKSIEDLQKQQLQISQETQRMNDEKSKLATTVNTLNATVSGLNDIVKKESLNVNTLRAEQTDLSIKIATSQNLLKSTDAQVKVLENVISGLKEKSQLMLSSTKSEKTGEIKTVVGQVTTTTTSQSETGQVKQETVNNSSIDNSHVVKAANDNADKNNKTVIAKIDEKVKSNADSATATPVKVSEPDKLTKVDKMEGVDNKVVLNQNNKVPAGKVVSGKNEVLDTKVVKSIY